MAEEDGTGEMFSISLRPLELEDADDVMVWKGDPLVARYCRWDTYTSRDQAVAFIRDFAVPHEWCRAICIDGRPVGCIAVTIGKDEARFRGLLKYELARRCWGKGVATFAVRLAVQAAFSELPGVNRIEAMVVPENKGSIRVLEKCGFQREALLRKYVFGKGRFYDLVLFSILDEEIQA